MAIIYYIDHKNKKNQWTSFATFTSKRGLEKGFAELKKILSDIRVRKVETTILLSRENGEVKQK